VAELKASSSIQRTSFLLKGASHILTQSPDSGSIFEVSLINSLQTQLARSIICLDSVTSKATQKYTKSLWTLFEQMISKQKSQALIDTCQQHLKQTMSELISEINGQYKTMVSLGEIEKVDRLTKLIKDFVELVSGEQRSALI